MKKLIFLLPFLIFSYCEKENTICDNPEIDIKNGTRIILTKDNGSNCGYNHLFSVWYGDYPQEAFLLTNDNHGFPTIHLGYYNKQTEKLLKK